MTHLLEKWKLKQNKQVGPIKLVSFCTSKETINKDKIIAIIFSELSEWKKTAAIQNIQVAHAAQYQKNKQPNQKMGKRTEETFL